MLATPLLALLASTVPTSGALQDSGRVPITAPKDPSEEEVRNFSISDLLTRMPTEVWTLSPSDDRVLRSVPAELQRRAEGGLMSGAEWVEALLASDAIHTRPRWPEGEPLVVWIREPKWLRNTRITARFVDPELGQVNADIMNPTRCVNCDLPHRRKERELTVKPLPAGTTRLSVEVSVDQRDDPGKRYGYGHGERPLWHGRFLIPIQVVHEIEQAIPPIANDEITNAIRSSIKGQWDSRAEFDGSREVRLTVGGAVAEYPALRGVALSVTVSLLHHGRAVSWCHATASDCVEYFDWSSGLRGTCHLPTDPSLTGHSSDLQGWEVQFTGRSDGVLPIWEADHWWNGSFTIPLSKALEADRLK
jgi:hypothetical protein